MKATRLILLFCLAMAPMLLAGPARADGSECQQSIATLRLLAESTAISGKNAEADRANLLRKLDEASAKLALGKYEDAIQKLTDLKAKVNQLAAAGKTDVQAADALVAGADEAITCIASLASGG